MAHFPPSFSSPLLKPVCGQSSEEAARCIWKRRHAALEEAARCNPQATVVFQLFDSRVYFASSEEGELTFPKRGDDGHFHVPGELVLADWAALIKIFTTALPLLRAGGRNRKLILSPLPRFVNSTSTSPRW